MKIMPQNMTNRELMTAYDRKDSSRFAVMTEMAKRIHQKMIMPDTVRIFSQYKLNGAGDQYC